MAKSKEMELAIRIGGKVDKSLTSAISATKGAINGIGKVTKVVAGAAAVGAAAAGALGVAAVKVGSEFESSMSQVAATMLLDKSTEEGARNLKLLEDAARECGRNTAFSASEASEALNYLALAGYDAEKAAAALPTILNLAGAGAMDLAAASDMVTDSMSALGLEATEDNLNSFADQLALTASKANTSVSQLGEAILTVGGTAKNLAGGTAELNTMLGVLADNGIKGAEGGTHLRNMILRLQTPTKEASKLLSKMGVELYDAQGNMRGLDQVFGELQTAMNGMSNEEKDSIISTIFKQTDLAAANALLGTSADRFNELTGAINNSKGAAEAMYNIQMDNLEGDIAKVKSGLSDLGISIYKDTGGPIRAVTQQAANMVSQIAQAYSDGGFRGAIGSIKNIMIESIEQAIDALPSLVNKGTEMFISFLDGMISKVDGIDSGILSNVCIGIYDTFYSSLEKIVPKIAILGTKIIQKLISGVLTALPTVLSIGMTVITNLVTGITQQLPQITSYAVEVIISFVRGIMSSLPQLITSAGEIIASLLNGLGGSVPKLIAGGAMLIGEMVKGLITSIPAIIQASITIVGGLASGLIQAIPAVLNAAKTIGKSIVDALKEIDWLQLGKDIINGIINGVKSLGSNIGSAIKNVVSGGKASVSVQAGTPAKHADGGIFTKPTLLNGGRDMVGEAGAEAVLPLDTLFSKMKDIMSGSNTSSNNITYAPTFNVTGANKDEVLSATRMAQEEFDTFWNNKIKQTRRTAFA